ncbi:hypothetical protein PHYBLDRAFT_176132 [Phycomyces blakesleeanus NRRL 1555(-)]|uniref:Uncharacterized protein n=1 Tax=Phycomyces blakesleeanus (strain ATCC 8743b / DSM 1359 / FGSC 10004 / NBRC 33097 / NRRL 1555) TaxID=763407 RepID=A0A162N3S4_PHYB8|nr:hypothetical protein PHYBLDRAFT_176132 [Phycomyces blakesleeanus NRRL 1555(-)]OAD65544.1 hypothetical protein PHYBLDRAFT_176132 [Phycomyces blakesleeanus NRRL 1555(-)]|eukprot:XP_018283584.1 hypothetical protein PHYBLDRAFT_176132 [Phycomyces blakesleeanus NRRL 1555(-)]
MLCNLELQAVKDYVLNIYIGINLVTWLCKTIGYQNYVGHSKVSNTALFTLSFLSFFKACNICFYRDAETVQLLVIIHYKNKSILHMEKWLLFANQLLEKSVNALSVKARH